jgi:dolichol-phosphate mannosyltransferase
MKLSVISPTFNEAENIPRLVEQLGQALSHIDYEILIVDDNSPDLTWSVAERISLTNPRVRILRRLCNPGLGLAVIDGFSAAQGEAVACIDADLQHDPRILPKMLQELCEGSDAVVGSRYVDGGGTGRWNWQRRFGSWTATKMAQLLLGVRLKDPMSGYFVMWRKDFARVQSQLNGNGFKIFLEILARLQPSVVTEIPYTFGCRKFGESKLSQKIVLQYLAQLWRLSKPSRLVSDRFLKFAVVGSIGVIVNLATMALLLHLTSWNDWQASAGASIFANLQNYVLNNIWSFADRTHRGLRVLKGYLSYLAMSAVGLGLTTGAYAGLTRTLTQMSILQNRTDGFASSLPRLFCQLIAVACGVYFSYELNKFITWPDIARSGTHGPKQPSRSALL